MIHVLIGLGSNIEREYHIRMALDALHQLDPHLRRSRVFEAEPVGFEGALFYNLVVELHTLLCLDELMDALRDIEFLFGREPNAVKYRSRTIDIDLLTYGDLCQSSQPCLPREDIYKFAFTLRPLSELCPQKCIPGTSLTYKDAWDAFDLEQRLWPTKDSFLQN